MEKRSRIFKFSDPARWRGYQRAYTAACALGGKLVSHTHQRYLEFSGGTGRPKLFSSVSGAPVHCRK